MSKVKSPSDIMDSIQAPYKRIKPTYVKLIASLSDKHKAQLTRRQSTDAMAYFVKLYQNVLCEEALIAAVKKSSNVMHFIDNPSEAVQLAAVGHSGLSILTVKKPSEAVQLAAVTTDANCLPYIKNPTYKVILAAVSRKPKNIGRIDISKWAPEDKLELLDSLIIGVDAWH